MQCLKLHVGASFGDSRGAFLRRFCGPCRVCDFQFSVLCTKGNIHSGTPGTPSVDASIASTCLATREFLARHSSQQRGLRLFEMECLCQDMQPHHGV